MKIKCSPNDFRVEELTEFRSNNGKFAVYRLTKESLGTLEALEAVSERWKIPRQAIAHGGLKDRHAQTVQTVTIDSGPRRSLKQESFSLDYVGQAARPFTSDEILGNRFAVVVRHLTAQDLARAEAELEAVRTAGAPNYFDVQRFGSLGPSGEFVAQPWCKGNFERALFLAIAEENAHDRPRAEKAKAALRANWGNWKNVTAQLRGTPLQLFVEHLQKRPSDYRGALVLLPQPQRSLLLAAFQSSVWNDLLALWLREKFPADQLRNLSCGGKELPFFVGTSGTAVELGDATLPLPSARLHLEEGAQRALVTKALLPYGLELREMRVKYPRDSFFSKGERAVRFVPQELHSQTADDEMYAGRRKLELNFTLRRGSYATVLITRILMSADRV